MTIQLSFQSPFTPIAEAAFKQFSSQEALFEDEEEEEEEEQEQHDTDFSNSQITTYETNLDENQMSMTKSSNAFESKFDFGKMTLNIQLNVFVTPANTSNPIVTTTKKVIIVKPPTITTQVPEKQLETQTLPTTIPNPSQSTNPPSTTTPNTPTRPRPRTLKLPPGLRVITPTLQIPLTSIPEQSTSPTETSTQTISPIQSLSTAPTTPVPSHPETQLWTPTHPRNNSTTPTQSRRTRGRRHSFGNRDFQRQHSSQNNNSVNHNRRRSYEGTSGGEGGVIREPVREYLPREREREGLPGGPLFRMPDEDLLIF